MKNCLNLSISILAHLKNKKEGPIRGPLIDQLIVKFGGITPSGLTNETA